MPFESRKFTGKWPRIWFCAILRDIERSPRCLLLASWASIFLLVKFCQRDTDCETLLIFILMPPDEGWGHSRCLDDGDAVRNHAYASQPQHVPSSQCCTTNGVRRAKSLLFRIDWMSIRPDWPTQTSSAEGGQQRPRCAKADTSVLKHVYTILQTCIYVFAILYIACKTFIFRPEDLGLQAIRLRSSRFYHWW